MRTHHLMAICAGTILLSACADGVPTVDSPDASVRETALRILEGAESSDALEQAITALGEVPNVSTSELDRVAKISRTGADEWTQISAIRVMQHWLTREALQAKAARELIRTAEGSHTPMVRGLAIQAIALEPKARWPRDVVVSLGDLVQNDPTPQNRSIAALALGQVRGGELTPIARESLIEAYGSESDLGTRRSMLLNIVEISGADAARVLANLPEGSMLAQQDIADYQEILRSGETRIAEIWDKKLAYDIERGTVIGTEDSEDRD